MENWYINVLKSSIPLAPKDKWCIAGYGCIIFKNKDMYEGSEHFNNIRARAVIKAAHEGKVIPMKPALQMGNACLNFIMSKKKHCGMWMRRCQDLVDDSRKLSAKLRMSFGNDSMFILKIGMILRTSFLILTGRRLFEHFNFFWVMSYFQTDSGCIKRSGNMSFLKNQKFGIIFCIFQLNS